MKKDFYNLLVVKMNSDPGDKTPGSSSAVIRIVAGFVDEAALSDAFSCFENKLVELFSCPILIV